MIFNKRHLSELSGLTSNLPRLITIDFLIKVVAILLKMYIYCKLETTMLSSVFIHLNKKLNSHHIKRNVSERCVMRDVTLKMLPKSPKSSKMLTKI